MVNIWQKAVKSDDACHDKERGNRKAIQIQVKQAQNINEKQANHECEPYMISLFHFSPSISEYTDYIQPY